MRLSFAPLDADAVVFLSEKTGVDFRSVDFDRPDWLCASARDDHGAVVGVLACEFKAWFDADFSTAIANPSFMSWRLLHAIFTALFSTAKRVSARIDPTNRLAIEQAMRLGFVVEGYLKFGFDGYRDAYLLGMTRDNCRWLKPRHRLLAPRRSLTHEVSNGQPT